MPEFRASPRKTNNSQLARIRMERGMTQEQLAKKIGAHAKDISRWENGARSPSLKSLKKLAAALECTIDCLTDQWN